MRVGNGRVDLTPKDGEVFYLLGYKMPLRNQPAKGVHDPIFGNGILLEEQGQRLFLWSGDLLELPDETAADIKTKLEDTFGIPRDQILLSVTHNHSSIRDFHRDWEFGVYNPEYDAFLMESVLEVYRQCEEHLQEAEAVLGRDLVTGYYSNRNHEGELADNTVTVLKFLNTEGKAFAGIVNWAVHSTAMSGDNLYLTGDLAGNTCTNLQKEWGFFPLFLNGAAGDSSNRFCRQGKDFAELERAAKGLSEKIGKIPCEQKVKLGKLQSLTMSHEIAPDMEKYKAAIQKDLEDIASGNKETLDHMPKEHLIGKLEGELKRESFYLNISFQVLDFGDLRIFVFPGELASKFGIYLREQNPQKQVLIAGYTNGFHYYFLNKEEYGLSFETIGNPVPAGEPEHIVEKMMQGARYLDGQK